METEPARRFLFSLPHFLPQDWINFQVFCWRIGLIFSPLFDRNVPSKTGSNISQLWLFNCGTFACITFKMSHQYHRSSVTSGFTPVLVVLSPITEMRVPSQRVLCFRSLIHVCSTASLWHPTRDVRHDRPAYTIPQPGPSGSGFCIWPSTWLASLRSPDILSDLRTYLINILLTAWCRVLLQKLTSSQLVKIIPAFYRTLKFITAFTETRHLSLSWARPIQFIPQTSALSDEIKSLGIWYYSFRGKHKITA